MRIKLVYWVYRLVVELVLELVLRRDLLVGSEQCIISIDRTYRLDSSFDGSTSRRRCRRRLSDMVRPRGKK